MHLSKRQEAQKGEVQGMRMGEEQGARVREGSWPMAGPSDFTWREMGDHRRVWQRSETI